MKSETQVIGDCAVTRLDKLLQDVEQETLAVVLQNDLPTTVVHYDAFDKLLGALKKRMSALEKHRDSLSYEILPTIFTNQGVKTITLPDVGRVTVNVRWTATILDKQRGLEWLRTSGNEGLIQETVNAGTLSSFAKGETLAGHPLPSDIFKIGTAQHISITKSGVVKNDDLL
jgi:hypothetical protein